MKDSTQIDILQNLPKKTLDIIATITSNLGVPREILASEEEINSACNILPQKLIKIPKEERNELIAKMCIAIGCGLFDSAINYI